MKGQSVQSKKIVDTKGQSVQEEKTVDMKEQKVLRKRRLLTESVQEN
jgi:hypothetical protein